MDEWKGKEREAQEKIEEDSKGLEKLSTKLNLMQEKITECTEKISQLGPLPSPETYQRFNSMNLKQVSHIFLTYQFFFIMIHM